MRGVDGPLPPGGGGVKRLPLKLPEVFVLVTTSRLVCEYTVFCSVLQHVAVFCSVLQRVARSICSRYNVSSRL